MNMKDKILDLTKKTLVPPMLGHVLHTTLEALPKEKALGPNGGYKVFSKLVGCDKKGIWCNFQSKEGIFCPRSHKVWLHYYKRVGRKTLCQFVFHHFVECDIQNLYKSFANEAITNLYGGN